MKQEDLFDSLSDHFEAKAEFGETEELTEANFVIPEESDYVDFGEDAEEVDVASLWENIRKKKEREGKNYRPAKPGDKDRPSQEALKRAQGEKLSEPDSVCKDSEPKKKDTSFVGKHQVTAPPTMTWQGATAKEHADDVFNNPGEAMKRAKELGLDEIHTHKDKKGNTIFMPGKTHEDYMDALRSKADTTEALQYGKPKKNDPRKLMI